MKTEKATVTRLPWVKDFGVKVALQLQEDEHGNIKVIKTPINVPKEVEGCSLCITPSKTATRRPPLVVI